MYEPFSISLGIILSSKERWLIPFYLVSIVLMYHLNKNYVCIVMHHQDQWIHIQLNLYRYIPRHTNFPTWNSITAPPKVFRMVQNYSESTPTLKDKPHIPQTLNLRVSHSNITPECCFRNFCQIPRLELVTNTSMINRKKINKWAEFLTKARNKTCEHNFNRKNIGRLSCV